MRPFCKHFVSASRKQPILKSGLSRVISILGDESDLFMRFLFSSIIAITIYYLQRAMGIEQTNIARIVLGFIFIGLLPGDALLLVIFPKRGSFAPLERFVFSVILSLIIVSLTGFIFNYTPWGITFDTLLISAEAIILICYTVSLLQRRSMRKGVSNAVPKAMGFIREAHASKISRKSIYSFAASIIGFLALTLLIGVSGPSEHYTEFFFLDSQYQLGISRNQYTLGESLPMNFIVINHEGEIEIYHLFMIDNHNLTTRITSFQLADRQEWNQQYNLILLESGENQSFRFVLYREGDIEPYRSLQITISVDEKK